MLALALGALVLAVLVLVRRTEDVLPSSALVVGGCGAAAVVARGRALHGGLERGRGARGARP